MLFYTILYLYLILRIAPFLRNSRNPTNIRNPLISLHVRKLLLANVCSGHQVKMLVHASMTHIFDFVTLVSIKFDDSDVGEIPVFLVVIKSVSHYELIGNLECGIVNLYVHHSSGRLVQKCAEL